MLLGGDELGRTQARQQQRLLPGLADLLVRLGRGGPGPPGWTQRLIALRRAHPVFRRRRFFQGHPLRGTGPTDQLPDIGWFRPDGQPMTDADWEVGYAKSLGVFLNGIAIPDPDVHGRPIVDDSFYLMFNGWDQEIDFTLPPARWACVLGGGARHRGRPIDGEAGALAPGGRPAGWSGCPGPRLLVLQSAPAPDDQD